VRIALAVSRRHSEAHLGGRTKRHWWRPFPTTQPTPTNQGAVLAGGTLTADGRDGTRQQSSCRSIIPRQSGELWAALSRPWLTFAA
jgi:hypothetical protein